eukprot:84701_1
MALATAVQFRALASQLTNEEKQQFIQTLSQQPNDIITTALFTHIVQSKDSNTSQNITDMIRNIIESRPENPQSIHKNIEKFDEIPKPCINITASFLDQKDYIALSTSNRRIFIACNHPKNSLKQLDLTQIRTGSYVNMSLFHSTSRLKIDCVNFRSIIKPPFNLERITHLQLKSPGPYVLATLRQFPNVQYLAPGNLASIFAVNSIQNIYAELKGLDLYDTSPTIQNSLLGTYGSSLDFLSLRDHMINYNLQTINFNKLEELKLFNARVNVVQDILSSAQNVKSVWLKTCDVSTERERIKEQLKQMYMAILRCKSLEYMELDAENVLLENILDVITECLYAIYRERHVETGSSISMGKQIKIKITTAPFSIVVDNCRQNVIFKLVSLINWMNRLYGNFMFILNTQFNANAFREELKRLLFDVKVETIGSLCLISNKECIIEGFGHSWKM